jgi:hypothetical protein
MKLTRFDNFINEATKPTILDCVIDNNGVLYDGKQGRPLIKGSVDWGAKDPKRIVSNSGVNYPAGIDKNGNIYSLFHLNSVGDVNHGRINKIDNDNKKIIDQFIEPLGNVHWKVSIPGVIRYVAPNEVAPPTPYYNNVPIVPTGWVNVKVDMEVVKRIRRYSTALNGAGIVGGTRSFYLFKNALREFEIISKKSNKRRYRERGQDIQKDMAVIMLLHYLNEIKDFFTPSAAGFLFESFIAGLIPKSFVADDNGIADIVAEGRKYQIKLYKEKANVDIIKEFRSETTQIHSLSPGQTLNEFLIYYKITEQELRDKNVGLELTELTELTELRVPVKKYDFLDYYIIAFKSINKISIYVFTKRNIENYIKKGKDYYFDDDVSVTNIGGLKKTTSLDISEIIREKNSSLSTGYFELDLSNIEQRIDKIAIGLKDSLDNLYLNLSKFQYNVETIITGIDETGRLLSGTEYNNIHTQSEQNLSNLNDELLALRGIITLNT